MNQVITKNSKSVKILQTILFVIIILVPFYAFFTTWISSITGGLLLLRAWKELLLLPATCIALYILVKDANLRRRFFGDRLTILMACFAAWLIFTTLLHGGNAQSVALGLAIQLRLFAVFLLARIVVYYRPPSRVLLEKLVLVPVAGVVVFGILQLFVLPYDFLKHFGYQKNVTIPPYFTIDEQISKIRIASTLRGPNTLGVYLILPLIMVAEKVWQKKRPLVGYGLMLLGVLIVLYGSHSRGAWIGVIGALLVWIFLSVTRKFKLILVSVAIVLGLVGGLTLFNYRESSFVQNVILHDNPEEGGDVSSNQGHLDSALSAVENIANDPIDGCGAGCAGPASVRSEDGANFAENYFLQTAQEGGLIALALQIMIFILASLRLLKHSKNSSLERLLLASFIGICIASLFAHSWADDTTAYLWWAIAGLSLTWPVYKKPLKD